MSTAKSVGIVVGVMIVAIVTAIAGRLAKNRGDARGKYDERQQVVRGRAFTWAYATLLVYLCCWMVLRTMEVPFFMESLSVIAGVLLSIAVFMGYSIFNDAYFKASESPRAWLAIICGAGLLNLGIGVMHLVRGEGLAERLYENVNLFVGVLLVVTLAFIVIKRAIDRRSEEE